MAIRACSRLTCLSVGSPSFVPLGFRLGTCLRSAGSATSVSWPDVSPAASRTQGKDKLEASAARSSREREVAAACAALSESVEAGDTAWFERVIIQLRSILLEKQSEDAATQVETDRTTFPVRADPLKQKPPMSSMPPKPSVATGAPRTPISRPSSQQAEAQPPWLEALRLLEEAAKPQADAGRPPAKGYFPARVQAEATPSAEEEKLQSYLDSFANTQVKDDEEDPAWARAIRILEAVPVGELEDPGRSTRFQSYQRLLQDGAGAEPGASLPVRFGSRRSDATPSQRTPPVPDSGAGTKADAAGSTPTMPSSSPPHSPASGTTTAPHRAPREEAVGTGRGHLVSALPSAATEVEDADLRKEDFRWSEHEFNDGEKENRRVLKEFTREFKKMAEATPDGVRNPKLLTAALDLALACVKCYELDKADAIYRRVLGECRRRGMPWDVKCLQDLATLRCKQHRQADAAELLEELAAKAPPHPATFINLGTVYNQLRQYDRAETWFHQAVNLKGGTPDKEDVWNLAICKKNMGRYDEALPMLRQALAEFQEQEPDQPVTIAKLHSSLGGCLHDMGRPGEAAEAWLVGDLWEERRHSEAFEALREAFEVHARCDSVHTTPLFECLEMAMDIQEQSPGVDLSTLRSPIEDAMQNLQSRGQDRDGNAGLVMSRAGKLLLRSGAEDEVYALQLLRQGRQLIQEAHDAKEANLAHELLEDEMERREAEKLSKSKEEMTRSWRSILRAVSRVRTAGDFLQKVLPDQQDPAQLPQRKCSKGESYRPRLNMFMTENSLVIAGDGLTRRGLRSWFSEHVCEVARCRRLSQGSFLVELFLENETEA
eukprot:s8_g46.t2